MSRHFPVTRTASVQSLPAALPAQISSVRRFLEMVRETGLLKVKLAQASSKRTCLVGILVD